MQGKIASPAANNFVPKFTMLIRIPPRRSVGADLVQATEGEIRRYIKSPKEPISHSGRAALDKYEPGCLCNKKCDYTIRR